MALHETARPILGIGCAICLACAPAAQSDTRAPIAEGRQPSASVDDGLAWLTAEPLDTRTEPCSACGGNKQEVLATRCSPGGKCRQLLRCTKCGVLSLQSEPREGMMVLGEEGPEAIMGPGDRLLHGDEALAYLADHGLRGLALFRKPSGRLAVLGVFPGSAASAAGLLRGDDVLRIGSTDCTAPSACDDWADLTQRGEGRPLDLSIERDGATIEVKIPPVPNAHSRERAAKSGKDKDGAPRGGR